MKTEFLLDYSTILANQARPVHLAIRFQAEGALNPRPRPAAFCVVLDRSGSMEGPPLDHAKQAANHGIVEPPAVRQVVVGGLEQDAVRTSCLGFGDNYNEDLMAELARATNGQFYDADSPETFPAIFASELDGLQRLAVQNLRVRVQALDFCEAYTLLGEYPALALPDGRLEFAVGDLVSDEQRIVCFGVQALALPLVNGKPPFDLQGELLLGFEVLWDELLDQGIVSRTLTQQVRIQATQDPAEVVVNGLVAPWVSMQKAGKVVSEVTLQMDRGQAAEALKALDKAIQELSPYGDRAAEAIKLLQDLKGKIGNDEWSLRERKNARYSSSSFRKMSSHEKWSHKSQAPSFKDPPKDADANPPTP
jgi:Ca-activated chloride channel family protein